VTVKDGLNVGRLAVSGGARADKQAIPGSRLAGGIKADSTAALFDAHRRHH